VCTDLTQPGAQRLYCPAGIPPYQTGHDEVSSPDMPDPAHFLPRQLSGLEPVPHGPGRHPETGRHLLDGQQAPTVVRHSRLSFLFLYSYLLPRAASVSRVLIRPHDTMRACVGHGHRCALVTARVGAILVLTRCMDAASGRPSCGEERTMTRPRPEAQTTRLQRLYAQRHRVEGRIKHVQAEQRARARQAMLQRVLLYGHLVVRAGLDGTPPTCCWACSWRAPTSCQSP
jgi:hypothetical protein